MLLHPTPGVVMLHTNVGPATTSSNHRPNAVVNHHMALLLPAAAYLAVSAAL